MSRDTRMRLQVGGMHCQACEVALERALRAVPGVRSVKASHARGWIDVDGDAARSDLEAAVEEAGYTSGDSVTSRAAGVEYLIAAGAVVFVACTYVALRRLELLPDTIALPDTVSYGAALLLGLAASVSTCMAVTGGLLVAVAARHDAAHPGRQGWSRFQPHVWFAVGRILAYPLFGAAIGALGAAVTPSPAANAVLIGAASVLMILFGLQMLGLLPSLGRFQPRMPRFVARRIDRLAGPSGRAGGFTLGVLSFFMPCGFTQALQIYVLAQADAVAGAWIMFAFAAGTLPALLSLSVLSSFSTGSFRRIFVRFAGIAVVLLGVLNIQSGLTLGVVAGMGPAATAEANSNSNAARSSAGGMSVAPQAGKQVVEMKIVGYDYIPNQFSVVAGTPVEWRIDASRAAGCGRILLAPSIGVQQILSATKTNTITFTPDTEGTIAFNCGMGMMTPNSRFVVRPGLLRL